MAKKADMYFQVEPWSIVEEGFNPEYSLVAESAFSLANEYMGVRGYFEEGYGKPSLQGSYFNGVYEQKAQGGEGYKGIVHTTEYMVNAVDWLYTRIFAQGEKLDLAVSKISDFKRMLDLKSGLLSRSFVWHLKNGQKIEIKMERLVSMDHIQIGAQRISFSSLDYTGEVELILGLDFSIIHQMAEKNMWKCLEANSNEGSMSIDGQTTQTGFKLFSACRYSTQDIEQDESVPFDIKKKCIARKLTLSLKPKTIKTVEKIVKNDTLRKETNSNLLNQTFDKLYQDNTQWWNKVWDKSDIVIDGDDENQQGIRYCIFQMFQTYHGAVEGTNIGAKGLTGEAYNGNAFWDTETYCLPFFLFHDVKAARNLLYFRYATLEEAKKRARDLDCKGAFYPIATISGRECCNLWQHASLQLQASTAVAYGIWLYEKMTGDNSFMEEYGLEMLIEISRMLASRGDFNENHTHYGYYCVMGPDEFQMMVNHNCYTNVMGKFTLQYTLKSLKQIQKQNKDVYQKVTKKTGFKDKECEKWQDIIEHMYIPQNEKTGIYEQHQGFFELPHVDVDAIPIEEFPLYHHWSYDRIYRNDMIKQPDVLMLMLLFNSSFSNEELKANYEYYEPKCIHESSLSPSVHSILASQLQKQEEAYEFFGFATRMDLDNYNRNSNEGLHTTSIAAAWMNIVYGFGGMRSDGDILCFNPTIPKNWNGYSFRIVYDNDVIVLKADKETITLHTLYGREIEIRVYGEKTLLGEKECLISIPKEWKG